jgi:hypothetical protein
MLVESGISVAPLERPRAPDAKHMAPPSVNMRSRIRRVEPLAAVVEKSASSDSDSEDDNDNESSGENEGGMMPVGTTTTTRLGMMKTQAGTTKTQAGTTKTLPPGTKKMTTKKKTRPMRTRTRTKMPT